MDGLTEQTGQEILNELKALKKFVVENKTSEKLKEDKKEEEEQKKLEEQKILDKKNAEKELEEKNAKMEQDLADKKALEDFRKAVIQELQSLGGKDDSEVLNSLDTNLTTISKGMEENKVNEGVGNYADLLIIFSIMLLVPAYLVYRGLSRFFDSVTGV